MRTIPFEEGGDDANVKGSLLSSKPSPGCDNEWMKSKKDVECEPGDGCEKAHDCESDVECESDPCCKWMRTNANDSNGSQSNGYGCEWVRRNYPMRMRTTSKRRWDVNVWWMRKLNGCEQCYMGANNYWVRTSYGCEQSVV